MVSQFNDRPAPRPPLRGPVLVVDDDDSVRRALGRLLACDGLDARPFGTAEEALESLELEAAACMVVDIMLPGIDGITLVERLGERGLHPPVILITAIDDERIRRRALDSGARGLLEKPVDPTALLALIRSVAS